MTFFSVSPQKQTDLERRMARLGIREEDFEEQFVRGSGPGGQKINKSSVAVVLSHPSSGIEVRCQETRSQALNRFLARRKLVERLETRIFGEKSRARQLQEKIRRQKRRRSRRAKEKMLADKKHHGEKKRLRKVPLID